MIEASLAAGATGAPAAEAGSAEGAASAGASTNPAFVGFEEGAPAVIPEGATGPIPTRGPGMQFTEGSGGYGLDPRVENVRIMDATEQHGARVIYENGAGQTVNPYTGRTIPKTDPWAHMPR